MGTIERFGCTPLSNKVAKTLRFFLLLFLKIIIKLRFQKKSANGKELTEKLSKALTELEKSGELTKIRKKYTGN